MCTVVDVVYMKCEGKKCFGDIWVKLSVSWFFWLFLIFFIMSADKVPWGYTLHVCTRRMRLNMITHHVLDWKVKVVYKYCANFNVKCLLNRYC